MPSQWPAGKNRPCASRSVAKALAITPGPTWAVIASVSITAVIETADVEQHAAVAQMACRPAVSAGTDADPVALRTRVADRGDDVVGIAGLHDHIGKALRQNAIPHRVATGRLVSVYTAVEESLCGE